MAGINVARGIKVSKQVFVKAITREVRGVTAFNAAQSVEVAERLFYLLANSHLNPLRAKAVAAGLL